LGRQLRSMEGYLCVVIAGTPILEGKSFLSSAF